MNTALYSGGQIHTLDPARPHAEALAVAAGRIQALGSSTELAQRFPSYPAIDLRGGHVFPGFVDSHIHLASFGTSLRRVQLDAVPSLQAAVERVARATQQEHRGRWILGRGWNKNLWPEGRFPTKEDLDAVSPLVPVALGSKDGHALWVNSAALTQAGIDEKTPDLPGGEISKDSRGRLSGILKEEAMALIHRVIPHPEPEDLERDIRQAIAVAHRLGLVAVHTFEGPKVFAAFQRLAERGELSLRVWNAIPERDLDAATACGLRTGFGNDWLRVGPVKIFADGALGSQTASLLDPYEGSPQDWGIATHSRDELMDLVGRALRGGFWCAIHAIGDRANRWVLDAYEAHHAASSRAGARHRIEHVQLLHPDDLSRLARLNVIASMQPIHAISDREIADRYWGRRSRYAYAWRSLLQRGTRLAFGSDAPVESPDVFEGLHAAVTRRPPNSAGDAWYPEEAIAIREALEAYTVGAVYAAGMDADAGQLSGGRFADFVVLSRDLLAASAQELLDVRVNATGVGGKLVYSAESFAG